MTFKRRLCGLISAAVLAIGLAVVPTTPAAAAPTCNYIVTYLGIMDVPGVRSSGSTNCVMGRGAQSPAVVILQVAMVLCHQQHLNDIDGIFGPETERVLRQVQARVGARVDGVYGPETFGKMARRGGWPSAISSGCIILT